MVSATFLQIKYRPVFHNEDGLITAVCRELGIAAVGDSNDEASAALSATVRIYCDALEARGTLERTLEQAGVSVNAINVERESDDDLVMIVGSGRSSS